MRTVSTLLGFTLVASIGCDPAPTVSERRIPTTDSEFESNPAFQVADVSTVDPKNLQIFRLQVVQVKEYDTFFQMATYEGSGQIDFVHYKICGKQGECIEGDEASLRLQLPAGEEGPARVTLWPCVKPERSTQPDNCGAPTKEDYQVPPGQDPIKAMLLNERQSILRQLGGRGVEMFEALAEFNRDLEHCSQFPTHQSRERLEALYSITANFMQLGAPVLASLLNRQSDESPKMVRSGDIFREVGKNILDGVLVLADIDQDIFGKVQIPEDQKPLCQGSENDIDANERGDPSFLKGIISSFNPLPGLKNVISSFKVLGNSKIKYNCTAESNLRQKHSILQSEITRLNDRIMQIDALLNKSEVPLTNGTPDYASATIDNELCRTPPPEDDGIVGEDDIPNPDDVGAELPQDILPEEEGEGENDTEVLP